MNADLRLLLDRLDTIEAALLERFDRADARHEQFEAELRAMREQQDHFAAELGAVREQVDRVDARQERFETELRAVREQVDRVDARQERFETELRAVREQVDRADARLERFEAEVRERFERIDYYFGLVNQELIRISERLGALEERVGALEERVGALEQRVGALEQRLGTLQAQSDGHGAAIARLESSLSELRTEMLERFGSVEEHLRTQTMRVQLVERVVVGQTEQLTLIKDSTFGIERGLIEVNGRIDQLGDDMRQRFRLVSERLGTIEKRNAA